jgi:AcrR family transcriptional regulator
MPRPRTVDDAAILKAAAEAIGESGPAAFTLAGVAARVGLSPATLLQRFGSKRELLLKLAESGPAWADEQFRTASARHTSPRKALIAALKAMTASVASPEALANNLAFLQIDLRDPDFHDLALAHAQAFRGGIQAILNEARGAGELRPDADTRRLAEAVEAVYNGALITWAVHRKGRVDNHLAKQLDTLLRPYSVERLHLG